MSTRPNSRRFSPISGVPDALCPSCAQRQGACRLAIVQVGAGRDGLTKPSARLICRKSRRIKTLHTPDLSHRIMTLDVVQSSPIKGFEPSLGLSTGSCPGRVHPPRSRGRGGGTGLPSTCRRSSTTIPCAGARAAGTRHLPCRSHLPGPAPGRGRLRIIQLSPLAASRQKAENQGGVDPWQGGEEAQTGRIVDHRFATLVESFQPARRTIVIECLYPP